MAGLPLTEIRKTGRGAGFWREIRSSVWDVKFGASVRHPGVSGRQLHVGGEKIFKKKNSVGKERETSPTVCSFKEGIREGLTEK